MHLAKDFVPHYLVGRKHNSIISRNKKPVARFEPATGKRFAGFTVR